MKDLSTLTRAVGPIAASVFAGILLGLPTSTNESSVPSAPASPPEIVRAADVPVAPVAVQARRVQGRAPASADARPIGAGAGSDQGSRSRAAERPAVGGMVIGMDPETGKLGMPTREQLKELSDLEQQRLNHSSAGLVEVHHPDGSVSVDLQGRFQEFATVRIGPDGELIFQCVDGAENAERALKGPILGPTEVAPVKNTSQPARAESEER